MYFSQYFWQKINKHLQNLFIKYLFLLFVVIVGFENNSFSQDTLVHQSKSPKDSVPFTIVQVNHSQDSLKQDTLKQDTTKITKKSTLEDPVKYSSADSISFKVKKRIINLYGTGEIVYQDLNLKSQNVELDMNKREVYARGKKDSLGNYLERPNFKQGSEEFDSDTLKYSFDSKKGLVYGLVTKQDQGYLHSQKTKVWPNKEVDVKNGKYTTCDLEHPHFYIAMTKAKVIPNDKIVTGPAYLVIEGITIPVGVPFGFFPNKKGRSSGILLPTFGYEPTRGYSFRNGGIYLGLGEKLDVTLRGDIYTLGSWRVSSDFNYKFNYRFNGSFNLTYASLVDNEKKLPQTYSIQWTHTQDDKASKNGRFGANVHYEAAGFSKNNSQTVDQLLKPSISSSISYFCKILKVGNLTVSANHSQNLTDNTITLSLPSVDFRIETFSPFKRKKAVGASRWYEDIRVSYSLVAANSLSNVKMDSTFYTKSTLNKFQNGIQHSIPVSTTIKLLKFFTLTPIFTYTDRMYFNRMHRTWDSTLNKDRIIDTLNTISNIYDYKFSASLSTTIYGMFVFKSKILKAIRHKITPTISYTYAPSFGAEKYGYYSTYMKDGEKVYYSLFKDELYGTPSNVQQQSVTLRLSNNLEMKVRNRKDTVTQSKKIALIDDLTIDGSYNFAIKKNQMSLIKLSGSTNLMKRVNVIYNATFDPYALGYNSKSKSYVESNRTMMDLSDNRRFWRITDDLWRVSTQYQFGPIAKDKSKQPAPKLGSPTPYFSQFSMPWNLNVSYSISIPRTYYYMNQYNRLDSVKSTVTQTLGVNGSVNITKNWRANFTTGWDLKTNKLTMTSLTFFRDLHCWDMSFYWIPFGSIQRYEFKLKVKASILEELKFDKKKSYNSSNY